MNCRNSSDWRIESSSTSQARLPMKTVRHPSCFWVGSRGALMGLGVLYLMDSQRPLKSAPFRAMPASASSVEWNSRMAVPEERPSSWRGSSTDLGPLPHWAKNSSTSSWVARQGRPRM